MRQKVHQTVCQKVRQEVRRGVRQKVHRKVCQEVRIGELPEMSTRRADVHRDHGEVLKGRHGRIVL